MSLLGNLHKRGITREVFLFWGMAIKIPSFRSYSLFLRGLLCNLEERYWWRETKDACLCPIKFADPFGLMVIMRRAEVLTAGEVEELQSLLDGDYFAMIPHESKAINYGKLKNRIVCLDYGS